MVLIPNLPEHWNDYGVDADDRRSIAIPFLWWLEHVRKYDRNRLTSECLPALQIAISRLIRRSHRSMTYFPRNRLGTTRSPDRSLGAVG